MSEVKHVQFWLDEEEYERLKREAEKKNLTTYALLKEIVVKRRQMLVFGYTLMVYSVGCTAVLLYLILNILNLL